MTSIRPSDLIGQRVREIRNSRGWTARDLAARCAENGAPEITVPVIANIETGRRDKQGRRRREVTIDEMLALAFALEVPPVLLFLPLNGNERLQVTSTREMDVLAAAAWVNADEAAMRYITGKVAPRTDEERARWTRWRRDARPLELLRELWLRSEILHEMELLKLGETRPDLSVLERADRLEWLAKDMNRRERERDVPYEEYEEYVKTIAGVADWLAGLGFTPPYLPRRAVETMREKNMLTVANPDELLDPDEET